MQHFLQGRNGICIQQTPPWFCLLIRVLAAASTVIVDKCEQSTLCAASPKRGKYFYSSSVTIGTIKNLTIAQDFYDLHSIHDIIHIFIDKRCMVLSRAVSLHLQSHSVSAQYTCQCLYQLVGTQCVHLRTFYPGCYVCSFALVPLQFFFFHLLMEIKNFSHFSTFSNLFNISTTEAYFRF